MSQMLKVTNHNPQPLTGRYDGRDYVFETDVPVELPLDACTHIFGVGLPDKRQSLNMLGLLIPGRDSLPEAMKKLERVTFQEGRYVYGEGEGPAADEADENVEPEEAPKPPAKRGRKTGGRPHVVGPGGE